jgi:tRNA nucleotidyltransferase (CCA-adding enzyme)
LADRDSIPFLFTDLPSPCYLVGGWVRDRVIENLMVTGRKPGQNPGRKLDLDLVMPRGAVETARLIAQKYGAGFVLLDAERQIARIVFPRATVDFARQVGDSIEADLGKRDFCMNAIALNCLSFSHLPSFLTSEMLGQLIDPEHGLEDLQRQQIRMVAPENLQADPLRILRGYRQAAQLGFELEPLTRSTAILFSGGLTKVAAERITSELIYLLAEDSTWLIGAIADSILRDWLPQDSLNLNRFSKIERTIANLKDAFPKLIDYFDTSLAGDRSVEITTKLTALIERMPEKLELSKAEQKFAIATLRYLPQFKSQLKFTSPQHQYQLFQATGNTFPAIVALAVAEGESLDLASQWLQQWLDPNDPIAHPLTLVSGDDLKSALNLPPSPKIGELLAEIRLAQVKGLLDSKQQAIAYAAKLINRE